jgi:tRNA (guanine-N7-)-methyltransferase
MKKNKELRIPFVWADRRSVLLDRLLYIPGFYDKHQEWTVLPWSDPQVFGQNNPVVIEYCSGNGEWICERAEQNPHINWVAVEKRFDRSRKIWARLHRKNLSNLYIICGEASVSTEYYIPKNSLSEVFINFPDPWPKLKHAKNRLITAEFLKKVALATLQEAKATFVTDDPPYAHQILEELGKSGVWSPLLEAPHYATDLPNYGKSFFADLWVQKGLTIHYLPFKKTFS